MSLLAILLLLSIWELVVIGLRQQAKEIKVMQKLSEPTRDELREAMRYHGILFAEQDETGEWIFIRDGKRCRLFTYKEKDYEK